MCLFMLARAMSVHIDIGFIIPLFRESRSPTHNRRMNVNRCLQPAVSTQAQCVSSTAVYAPFRPYLRKRRRAVTRPAVQQGCSASVGPATGGRSAEVCTNHCSLSAKHLLTTQQLHSVHEQMSACSGSRTRVAAMGMQPLARHSYGRERLRQGCLTGAAACCLRSLCLELLFGSALATCMLRPRIWQDSSPTFGHWRRT
jgi:hypothetical protein